jgi:hypothetical protein
VAPLIVMLTLPTIIDTLDYVGNLDYERILESGAEFLRQRL